MVTGIKTPDKRETKLTKSKIKIERTVDTNV